MADQKCRKCNYLFNQGDKIRAEVLSTFVALKSNVIFAIERPYDCSWIEHVHCNFPQTGAPEGD